MQDDVEEDEGYRMSDVKFAEMQALQKKWEEERKQKRREYDREYRQRNLDRWRKYDREWKQNNLEATKETRRRTKFKQNYGLTIEEYDEMLEAQGGCCAICKSNNPRGHGRFHVDHNHKTGKIRGLLCHNCNLTVRNHSAEFLITCAAYVAKGG